MANAGIFAGGAMRMQCRLLAAAGMAAVFGMLGNAAVATEQGCPLPVMDAATRLGKPVLHGQLELKGRVRIEGEGNVQEIDRAALSAIEWDCAPRTEGQGNDSQDFVFLAVDDRKHQRLYYALRLKIHRNGIGAADFLWARKFPDVLLGERFNDKAMLRDAGLEGLRLDPVTKSIYLSTEEPSAVIAFDIGKAPRSFEIPKLLYDERSNNGLEGLALSPDRKRLFAAMELPVGFRPGQHLKQPLVTPILEFDVVGGPPRKEHRYCLGSPTPPRNQLAVSEILAVDATTLLVLERQFTPGNKKGHEVEARLYRADLDKPVDAARCVHKDKEPYLDLDKLRPNLVDGWIDNLEGMTFGPDLCNGDGTLLLITDNNGKPDRQRAQLIVLRLERGLNKPCS